MCQLQNGQTALHVANNVEVVDYLLSIGLNTEDRDKVLLLTLLVLTCSYCFKLFRLATHHFLGHVVMVTYRKYNVSFNQSATKQQQLM